MSRSYGNILLADALPPERSPFGGRMTRHRCFQRGSLIKRGTRRKVWVARWWEDANNPGNGPTRIRRAQVLGPVSEIPTRREAQSLLDQLLRRINLGDSRPLAVCTLRQFIEDRWKPETYPALKFSSRRFYDSMVNTHLNPVFGETQLRSITRDAVQGFLIGKSRSGLSWRTVKHIRTAFGTILESAVTQELLDSNPVRRTRMARRGPVKEHPVISPESVQALIGKLAEPSRSIAELLAITGLRIGEMLALRWQDVDLQTGFLAVRQTVFEGRFDEPKSKGSRRTVPLGPRGIEIFSALQPNSGGSAVLVFSTRRGSPLSRRNLLNRQLKPAGKAIGLPDVTWHWLRHANATLLDSAGTPLGTVQALLGHASSQITRDTYIHSVPADARRAVEDVEKLIGPKWTQVRAPCAKGSTLIQ